VDMIPHTEVTDPAVEPTCTDTGLTEGSHCSVCGIVMEAQSLVERIPHTEVTDPALEATCTDTGLTEGSHCSVCGTVIKAQVKVLANGHDYSETLTPPTCTSEGYTYYECKVCGDSYNGNYVDAVLHDFVDKHCVYCGEEEFGEINYDLTWYTSSDTFVITTRRQLAGFAYLVNRKNVSFLGKTVKLGDNIDLLDVEWIPIGSESKPFAGEFDGCGFTVSGFKVTAQTSYAGLFGRVSGELHDFTVSDAFVSAADGGSYIAIACGYTSGELSNISVSGSVEASGCSYVGGVAGRAVKGGTASYTGLTSSADVVGGTYVGGILGDIYNETDGNWDYTLTVNNCTNSGSVSGADFVGGLFGRLYAKNAYDDTILSTGTLINSGNVSASGNYVGGIVGYCESDSSSSAVSNAINSADVVGNAYVGGIAGRSTVAIKESSNEGSTVTATGHYTSGGNYYAYLGGIVGYGASLEGCVNGTDITYTDFGRYVGGIAGYMNGTAYRCTNNGDVFGRDHTGGIAGCVSKNSGYYGGLENTGAVSGGNYVGGIFGEIYSSIDEQGSHSLTVSVCKNSGNISGTKYVGGVLGRIYVHNDYNSKSRIYGEQLENVGSVSGTEIVGGIMGEAKADRDSSITGCVSSGSVTGESRVDSLVASSTRVSLS